MHLDKFDELVKIVASCISLESNLTDRGTKYTQQMSSPSKPPKYPPNARVARSAQLEFYSYANETKVITNGERPAEAVSNFLDEVANKNIGFKPSGITAFLRICAFADIEAIKIIRRQTLGKLFGQMIVSKRIVEDFNILDELANGQAFRGYLDVLAVYEADTKANALRIECAAELLYYIIYPMKPARLRNAFVNALTSSPDLLEAYHDMSLRVLQGNDRATADARYIDVNLLRSSPGNYKAHDEAKRSKRGKEEKTTGKNKAGKMKKKKTKRKRPASRDSNSSSSSSSSSFQLPPSARHSASSASTPSKSKTSRISYEQHQQRLTKKRAEEAIVRDRLAKLRAQLRQKEADLVKHEAQTRRVEEEISRLRQELLE